MRILGTAISVLALSATMASAGGLDRSGQGIGILFKEGNFAQLTFGSVTPSVTGTYFLPAGTVSGNMAPSYQQFGGGVKFQFSESISLAVIFDEPWGADVNYANSTSPLTAGASATINSLGRTALIKYDVNDNVSVYGGVRINTMDMQLALPAFPGAAGPPARPPAPAYTANGASSTGIGYVVGAAYEIPDIALRASLTYSSATTHDINVTENNGGAITNSVTRVTMPQSLNLDFQTGIAADTLLTAGVRWVNWTATDIDPPAHRAARLGSLQKYDEDSYTFSLGLGRRFSDSFAGSATLGWERPQGGTSGNLSPTDGNISLSLGGSYTVDNVELNAGVRYVRLGDATVATGSFTNNSAVALGMSVGYSF